MFSWWLIRVHLLQWCSLDLRDTRCTDTPVEVRAWHYSGRISHRPLLSTQQSATTKTQRRTKTENWNISLVLSPGCVQLESAVSNWNVLTFRTRFDSWCQLAFSNFVKRLRSRSRMTANLELEMTLDKKHNLPHPTEYLIGGHVALSGKETLDLICGRRRCLCRSCTPRFFHWWASCTCGKTGCIIS